MSGNFVDLSNLMQEPIVGGSTYFNPALPQGKSVKVSVKIPKSNGGTVATSGACSCGH